MDKAAAALDVSFSGGEQSGLADEPATLAFRNLSRQAVFLAGMGYLAILLLRLLRVVIQGLLLRRILQRARPADSRSSGRGGACVSDVRRRDDWHQRLY